MLVPMAEVLLDWTERDTSIFFSCAGVEVIACDIHSESCDHHMTCILCTAYCWDTGGVYHEQMGWRQVRVYLRACACQ